MPLQPFAVVGVPSPFGDHETTKERPTLLQSDPTASDIAPDYSVTAIISPRLIRLGHGTGRSRTFSTGLPAPSKVRFKLFTVKHRLVRG